MMRFCMSANSGPRWLIIWRDSSASVSSGQAVGPGMRRFCVTNRLLLGVEWIVTLAIATVNAVVKILAMFGFTDGMSSKALGLLSEASLAEVHLRGQF